MDSSKKGKKILIFHPTIAPYRLSFFNELNKNFETKICLYYENLKNQKFDYEKIIRKFEFEPDYFTRNIKIKNQVIYLGHSKRILKYNPDIVIVGEYGEGLWSAIFTRLIFRKHYKIITICDDSLVIAEQCRGLRKISRNLGIRYLDGIILCSDKTEAWYRKSFGVKTFFFPIIQDEKVFRENETQIVDLAYEYIREYNLVNKRVFLYVGRLAPEKNIEYLVYSFIESHKLYPDSILVLVGGVSEKNPEILERLQEIIREADGEDYIIYNGRKEGIALKAWYFVGQIFVLPSKYEPFGAVVNEALLAGEYVMVSENAGAACLVNGLNGIVLDISQPFIDFSKVILRVKPIDCFWKPAKSKMLFLFEDKIQELIEWIRYV